jgi:hypothetical protein
MKKMNTKPLYSKKEIITKETIKGHLRNWICEEIVKRKITNKLIFRFEMENMAVENGNLLLMAISHSETFHLKYTIFVDNIMRYFLGLNNNSYLPATKTNLMKLKKLLKPLLKKIE